MPARNAAELIKLAKARPGELLFASSGIGGGSADAAACLRALARLTGVVDKLLIYPERMQANMDRMGGLIHSQRVLLALTQAGMSREASYAAVQRNAMQVWQHRGDRTGLFAQHLKSDPEVSGLLSSEQIDAMFDDFYHLKHVDAIFERVFGPAL